MQRLWTFGVALSIGLALAGPAAAISCGEVKEGTVVGSDGQFLGEITASPKPLSIFNKFGIHGSTVHQTSVWNKFSPYGATYSDQSAFALFASNPPAILDRDGKEVGHLTRNRAFRLRMSPGALRSCQ